MLNKYTRIIAGALLLGVIAAIASTPGGWQQFKFRIGNYNREGETRDIAQAIKLFSASIGGFYATAGDLGGLNAFPAERMIKRRIFQDININMQAGKVLVMDRDSSELRKVHFIAPDHAIAVVDESWFMQFQNVADRKPVSDKKANFILVRYDMKKIFGRWMIDVYDVYGLDDTIPLVGDGV